jgi:hypothetical protein
MFALSVTLQRNGAQCREYYQPDSTEPVPGIVTGLIDGKKRAKHYPTEEEATSDIPAFQKVLGLDLAVDVVPV